MVEIQHYSVLLWSLININYICTMEHNYTVTCGLRRSGSDLQRLQGGTFSKWRGENPPTETLPTM